MNLGVMSVMTFSTYLTGLEGKISSHGVPSNALQCSQWEAVRFAEQHNDDISDKFSFIAQYFSS